VKDSGWHRGMMRQRNNFALTCRRELV